MKLKTFSPQEYEEYLEFKDDEVCEYTPDIVSDFCQKKGIDENERKIGLLAYKFEKMNRVTTINGNQRF